jgi:uncharacterized protein YjiS (DUF1127 family)
MKRTDEMTTYHAAQTRFGVTSLIWQVVQFALRGIGDYRRCQRDYRRLLELPDRQLDDMGLTRGEIIEAMRKPLF